VKEYDIFVPLTYNDGSPIEATKLQRIHKILLDRFEGLTYFPQPNEGYWTMANVTYKDEIVIYRVLTTKTGSARKFLKRFKEKLKQDLKQEEILIIERDVRAL
jgi:hypothetical protein